VFSSNHFSLYSRTISSIDSTLLFCGLARARRKNTATHPALIALDEWLPSRENDKALRADACRCITGVFSAFFLPC